MYPNGAGTYTCAVKKSAREKARYRRDMATPEGRAKRAAKWRRQMENRRTDPSYQLYKQLHEMARTRVRY